MLTKNNGALDKMVSFADVRLRFLYLWDFIPTVDLSQRKKRLNTIPYFTVLGQITSIYRHKKTVNGKKRDRIQVFFG